VTELLLPVVLPETLPPPAVTVLVMLPDGACSPGFSCTTLHPPGLLADLPAFWAWATATKLTHASARIPIVRFMIDVLVCGRKRRQPRGPNG
jgi:hypothetical protein